MRAEEGGSICFRQGLNSLILKLGRVCGLPGLPPPPDYQQAGKYGYSLPLEVGGDAQWLSQAMAASDNTHVLLRSQIQSPGSGSP